MFSRGFISELKAHAQIFAAMTSDEAKAMHAGYAAWDAAHMSDTDKERLTTIDQLVQYYTDIQDNQKFIGMLQAKGADMGKLIVDRDSSKAMLDKLSSEKCELTDFQFSAFVNAYRQALPASTRTRGEITLLANKVCQVYLAKRTFYVVVTDQEGTRWQVWENKGTRFEKRFDNTSFSTAITCRTPTASAKVVKFFIDNPKATMPYVATQKDVNQLNAGGLQATKVLEVSADAFVKNVDLKHFSDLSWLK